MMMASVLLGAGRRLAAHGRFDLLGPRGRQISLLTAYAVGVIITGSWGLTTNVFTGCCLIERKNDDALVYFREMWYSICFPCQIFQIVFNQTSLSDVKLFETHCSL